MICSLGDSAVGKQIVKIPFGCIEPIAGEVESLIYDLFILQFFGIEFVWFEL